MGDMQQSGPGSQPNFPSEGREGLAELTKSQLDKILASRAFHRSERLKGFLRYVLERSIQGDPVQVKEYLIGMEVFERGSSYDPRHDPIVRVEAHRLRSKLRQYYRTEGRKDRLLIEIPKGAYVPILRQRKIVSRHVQPIRPEALSNGGRKTIAVLPFVNMTAAKRTESFADSLTEDVTHALGQAQQLRVAKAGNIRKIGDVLRADCVIEGSVQEDGGRLRIHVRLIRTAGGRRLWSGTYESKPKDRSVMANEISRTVLSALRRPLRAAQQYRIDAA